MCMRERVCVCVYGSHTERIIYQTKWILTLICNSASLSWIKCLLFQHISSCCSIFFCFNTIIIIRCAAECQPNPIHPNSNPKPKPKPTQPNSTHIINLMLSRIFRSLPLSLSALFSTALNTLWTYTFQMNEAIKK